MNVDRRLFLFGSAVAAHAFQAEKPVNTAMIGTGNRGSFLLQGVLRQPNAKVLALCDIKPDRLDKAATAAASDNPATYADWHKVIERKDVDAVFIATPPYLHSEMAIAAIKAGKNVYCEKPLGVTPAQVRALLDAAQGSNKVFVAGAAVAVAEAARGGRPQDSRGRDRRRDHGEGATARRGGPRRTTERPATGTST